MVWFVRVRVTAFAATSHTRTVRSSLTAASRFPSGLKATHQTSCAGAGPAWALRVATNSPVSAFHTLTVPSKLADARRRPSGLYATPRTWPA
jgi:hypothetical protein